MMERLFYEHKVLLLEKEVAKAGMSVII